MGYFILSAGYPETAPNVVIKSSQLSDHDKEELTRYLQRATKATPIASLVALADEWLKTQNLEYVFIQAEESEKKAPKKGKKKQKQKAVEEDVTNEKKCSMKTAEEVIKRIQWDSALPAEDFIVGYLDRFIGVVEKQFSAFSWEDIASVDYDELAIPQHRIQYFKFKREVVWDKNKRLDNFFGSTGSKKTILDVIANYDAKYSLFTDRAPKQSPLLGEDSDSDDDEVVVHTGFSDASLPKASEKETSEVAKNDDSKNQENEGQETQPAFDGVRARDLYWGEKRRPTHFLCLRMTDPKIRQMAKIVQNTVQALEPDFAQSFIPVERLHITLACVGLDTTEDVNKASRALLDLEQTLQEMDPQKIEVELNGIGNFFDNVLYAKVAKEKSFMDFVELIQSLIIAADIEIRDVFDFHPHMTLLKFKKAAIKERKTRCVLDSRIYSAVGSPYFGKQVFSNIHLCVMSEQCDENGFYITPAKISFTGKSVQE